jgi:L-ascorbate metabolism protein UlaG (beta-lactamase superfamily)
MLQLTFHGHACFLVEGDGRRIVIDPFLTGNPAAVTTADRLPTLDAILLSHGHRDHLGDAIPLSRRDRAPIVAPAELARFCESRGASAHAMGIGGRRTFPFGTVKLVPAIHGGGVEGDDGTHTTVACGLLLRLADRTVYHAGDTALTTDMGLLQGQVDVMLAPIGDNYTMGVEDAVRAVEFVQPRVVIPMHYNTWDVVSADPHRFRTLVGHRAEVVILAPGETYTVP